jgi:hypothetical protein
MIFLTLLLTALPVSGCATSPAAGDWCLTNDPQRPSVSEFEAMDATAKRAMLAHNLYGQKLCGWKP